MIIEKEKKDLTPIKDISPAKNLPPSNSLKRSLKQFESLEDMEIEDIYPKLIGESLINCSSTKKMRNDIKKADKVYL